MPPILVPSSAKRIATQILAIAKSKALLWYHPPLQWTTCSKLAVEAKEQDVTKIKNDATCSMLATKGQEQGVKTVQD